MRVGPSSGPDISASPFSGSVVGPERVGQKEQNPTESEKCGVGNITGPEMGPEMGQPLCLRKKRNPKEAESDIFAGLG